MTESKVKLLGVIFRGVALLLLVVGFLFLFIEGDVTVTERTWGIKISNNERVDLESDYSYSSENFFGRVDRLDYLGHSVTLEWVAIAVCCLTLIYIVASIFVKVFKKIYFCALPISTVGLLTAILIDNDTVYSIQSLDFLGTAYGYNVYTNTVIEFDLVLIPSIVFVFLVFALMLTASVVETIYKKRMEVVEREQIISIENSHEIGESKTAEKSAITESFEVTTLADDLKELKNLLDADIITQEEFDAKKKQLLNL